ncbi:DUF2274 domain-containing protein [Phyllobacterium phragmitis]|uniref:DUF2274 domain-containing protein n=1 Tax=Phyllobacterium phragmitis TaxID=2670329 RepID=A0A2S9IRF4_9HYPH|nr:DUF2274 domain-containing protein [Phyllobacterium phragmitis]PRD43103.1 DUF2274 domain-containing protein [Phyllobacterium phragmitis]
MTKLRLSTIPDDRPVKITVELPAPVFRDLQTYAEILTRTTGEKIPLDPAKLVVPMVQRFMATDKGFAKAKRTIPVTIKGAV